MKGELGNIIDYLKAQREFDFTGNRPSMIQRRIGNRLSAVGCADYTEYMIYLQKQPRELNALVDVLTINVSRFFRETLTFEYIADRVLSPTIQRKGESSDRSLRIWSAGCSTGEEPYSVAILVNELMAKEQCTLDLNIFGTDIDEKSLEQAQAGTYPFESIKNVKYRFLKKHFTIDEETYTLEPAIRDLVKFSFYDMLDKSTHAPPVSVFGNFDIILCRNVLIYFQAAHQEIIFKKLFQALDGNGHLVLGEAETPPLKYRKRFVKENPYCNIYRKKP
ncbi:MAG: protein-glutamate O-methyltransferase CheR [Desulfobacterales bacterium]